MFISPLRHRTVFSRLAALVCSVAILTVAQPAAYAENAADTLETGFHQMYSLDFPAAHKTFDDWQQRYPDDPLGPASSAAAYLFSELDRLRVLELELFTENKKIDSKKSRPDSRVKAAFESEVAKAERIAMKELQRSPKDVNCLFARVVATGLKGDYLALIEKKNSDALKYLKTSRSLAEELIAIDPTYYDAYLAIGIESYLLGIRSAPMRWFLRMSGAKANKEDGIAKLQITASKGRYLGPFARVLLAIAALRDHDKTKAEELLTGLAEEFPQNHLYRQELARLRS